MAIIIIVYLMLTLFLLSIASIIVTHYALIWTVFPLMVLTVIGWKRVIVVVWEGVLIEDPQEDVNEVS